MLGLAFEGGHCKALWSDGDSCLLFCYENTLATQFESTLRVDFEFHQLTL